MMQRILRSRTFYIVIIALFVVQAAWLAVSARSLPFDEYYHMGIIQIYAQQWSPVIAEQPYEASLFGDTTRLHSYFYHYAMSFPYRLFSVFTESIAIKTVLLRFINIGLILGAITLFRRLFQEAGLSRMVQNVATFFFVSTPIVVLLAAQVNYDNLIILLTPLLFMYAYRVVTKPLTFKNMSLFLSIGLLSGIVKHLSLAVFGVLAVYVLAHCLRKRHVAWDQLSKSFRRQSRYLLVGSTLFLVVTGGLFLERHGLNIMQYGSVNVRCESVQPVEVCNLYSPWRRNEAARQNYTPPEYSNPAAFLIKVWIPRMANGPFDVFTNIPLDVPIDQDPYGHYVGKHKIWLHPLLGYFLAAVSLVVLIVQWRQLWAHPLNRLFLVVGVILTTTVFIFNYRTNMSLGQPYAIQPRYLLPLYLPTLVLVAQAARLSVPARLKSYLTLVAVAVMVLFWYGGGVAGWLVRADSDWYWGNATIVNFNQTLQSTIFRHLY